MRDKNDILKYNNLFLQIYTVTIKFECRAYQCIYLIWRQYVICYVLYVIQGSNHLLHSLATGVHKGRPF